MSVKQAMRRYRDRQSKRQDDAVKRAVNTAMVFMQVPVINVDKKTDRIFANYSVSNEMVLHAGARNVRNHADRELAKELGYELLKHAKYEERSDDFGMSFLASIEVVKER